MYRRFSALSIILLLTLSSSFALITFENPQINRESKILYTVKHELGGTESYRTLFQTDATGNENTKILTCFPEKMELLSKGALLQIRNRYGTARYSIADETLSWITRYDGFPTDAKSIVPETASSDGKWLCYLKKTGAATGLLVLKNAMTMQEYILDDKAEFDYEKVPAKWSPEKDLLLYEKDGGVYFCDPKAFEQNLQMDDSFRRIGDGAINCIEWANPKYIIYINRDLIYKIGTNELYTRALYSPVVGAGVVVGRIPLGFDPKKDHFWVNRGVNKLITIKSNSVISVYKITGASSSGFTDSYSKPFTDVRGSVVDYNLFWASDGTEILWVNLVGIDDGKKKSSIYRLSSYLELVGTIEQSKEPVLSPDGSKIVFGAGNNLFVYSLNQWDMIGYIKGEKFISYVWNGNETIYAGGASTVREWKMEDDGKFGPKGKILFLSSVKSAFWKLNSETTVTAQCATNDAIFFDYDHFRNVWLESAEDSRVAFEFMKKAAVKSQVVQNGKYRVYTGTTDNLLFENALYVRTLTGNGSTAPVFEEAVRKTPARRQVALVFDAVDSADGVTDILSVLSDYGIKGTFFLNGEFIRRYPKETKQIFLAGHDCASMFFTLTDFNEKGYVIDEEFVRRGLARNEDEFFAATGSELLLMWHAPFYKSTERIRKFGRDSGYKYIECSRLSLDTNTLEKSAEDGRKWYLGARDLVEIYVENAEDHMIIPVSAGISKGTRKDYLYEKLRLLIGDLLDEGFEFVPVRNLK